MNTGIMQALRDYKPLPEDLVEQLPDDLSIMLENITNRVVVKIAVRQAIYATPLSIELAQSVCCDNWHNWLSGLVKEK